MAGPEIHRAADLAALRELPRLAARDREVLERLVVMSPDAAIATASAILRTHQGDLHDLFFPPDRQKSAPPLGQLAAALVYLALAISAPGQGKFLPILTARDVAESRQLGERVTARLAVGDGPPLGALLPDAELVRLLETFLERARARLGRAPAWLRPVVMGEAAGLHAVLARATAAQFHASGDLAAAVGRLERAARTRDLLVDALAPDEPAGAFDPEKREARRRRLREFGWHEHVASRGRTLAEIARDAAAAGLRAFTDFALGAEWAARGASRLTTGGHYFIRPALVPGSAGLSLRAQEERLAPLQKILAGDPAATGLRLTLPSAELLLEYLCRSGERDVLLDRWSRVANKFDGMHTRFGLVDRDRFAITLFPASRHDEAVGVCPVVEVLNLRDPTT